MLSSFRPPRQGRGSRVEVDAEVEEGRAGLVSVEGCVCVCVLCIWCGVCVCMSGVGCVFVCQCRLVVRTRASHARDRGFDPLH